MRTALVKRAAKALDKRYPGWADKVDTDTLDLAAGKKCVTAQIGLGGYERDNLPLYVLEATLWEGCLSYDQVQEPWVEEVIARQS